MYPKQSNKEKQLVIVSWQDDVQPKERAKG